MTCIPCPLSSQVLLRKHTVLTVLFVALLSACGGPPRRPDSASSTAAPTTPPHAETALRFLRDGEPVLHMTRDGRVFHGGQLLGRFSGPTLLDAAGDPLVTFPEQGPLRAADGAELPFVILDNGTLLVEGQDQPARFDAAGQLVYPAVEDLRVRVVGDLERYRRQAMALVLFQSGFLSDNFRAGVRRARARKGRDGLTQLLNKLASHLQAGGSFPAGQIGPTPSPACDARDWPDNADPHWEALDFSPSPTRFAYAIERRGRDFTLTAEANLECHAEPFRYSVSARLSRGGKLEQVGDITTNRPLE